MTYWAMNAVFLGVAGLIGALALLKRRATGSRSRSAAPLALALVLLLATTAVFDNIMIGVGLVGYDPARISGAFVGTAPLEDFAYTIAAVVLLPSLWVLLERNGGGSRGRRGGGRGGRASAPHSHDPRGTRRRP